MKFMPLSIPGAWHITPQVHSDERGSFVRVFCRDSFAAQGLETEYRQHSLSHNPKKGTLRGLHFQHEPYAEVKLVSCTHGRMYDVIVDIRRDSPAYLRHEAVILDGAAPSLIYIPKGVAHGFLTLTDDCQVHYDMSAPYHAPAQGRMRWNDPKHGIGWPGEVKYISQQDRECPDWE